MALVLARYTEHALSLYFTLTSILSAGLFGLFFLAFFSTRANRRGVWAGIIACLVFTAYATLTQGKEAFLDLGEFNFKLPGVMIGVIGHLVLMIVGYAASLCFPTDPAEGSDLTLWGWLQRKKSSPSPTGVQPAPASPSP